MSKQQNFIQRPEAALTQPIFKVASLEDKYFLKTQNSEYFYFNSTSKQMRQIPESAVASGILNHGYKPCGEGEFFEL
jgi:hypothetical protein